MRCTTHLIHFTRLGIAGIALALASPAAALTGTIWFS